MGESVSGVKNCSYMRTCCVRDDSELRHENRMNVYAMYVWFCV